MFVTALDRPWEGTPFLIQGFLVDEIEHIETLRSLCSEVVIDPHRSSYDSLRDLIDLYDLPEDEKAPAKDEPTVRMRVIESGRSSGHASSLDAWRPIARLKTSVSKGLGSLRPKSELDVAWRPRSGSDPAQSKPQEEIARMPRFSRSDIRYASVEPASTPGPRGNLFAAWKDKKKLAGSRPLPAADPGVAARLAQFEEIVRSMRSDVSSWMENIGTLRKAKGAAKAPIAPLLGWRKRRLPMLGELHIPKYIEVLIYRDRVEIGAEVARAREAITSAEDTLARLKADVEIESALRIDGLPAVVDSLVASISRNADAMIWVSRVRLNDSTAYNHSIKVASYLMAFGRHLGFPARELGQLAQIGLLMDVGKLDLDRELLNKRTALTIDELQALKDHVSIGLRRLSSSAQLDPEVLEGIAQHHEWIDGSGYPEGLSGEEIGIFGRMAAIADTFAALTTHRPYAPTYSSYEALQMMYARADQQLHGPLVEQFVRAIGLYPVGSLVLLSTEEVAVVTALDKAQRLEPRVLVLTEPNKNTRKRPYELDLLRKPKDAAGQPIRILRSLPAGVHNIDFRNFYIA